MALKPISGKMPLEVVNYMLNHTVNIDFKSLRSLVQRWEGREWFRLNYCMLL